MEKEMEAKAIWKSKTFWVNVVSIVAMLGQMLTGKEFMPVEAQATLLAAVNVVLRMITNGPVAWSIVLVAMLAPLFLGGCARNTNSFNIGGTGMYLQTPIGMIALGNFEAHVATSELGQEELVVTDEKFFEGAGSMGADGGEDAGSTLNTQRSYSMRVTPVKTSYIEEAADAVFPVTEGP